LTISGFLNTPVSGLSNTDGRVYAHDLTLRRWFNIFVLEIGWEHFYEPRRDIDAVDTLDLFSLSLRRKRPGRIEGRLPRALPLVGALLLNGVGDVIPAFDVGLEVRAYPLRPLTFYHSTTVSVFAHGPLLIDTRLEAGFSFRQIDFSWRCARPEARPRPGLLRPHRHLRGAILKGDHRSRDVASPKARRLRRPTFNAEASFRGVKKFFAFAKQPPRAEDR